MSAKFGPSGSSESFYNEGFKHTYQAPAWLAARGLDAFEYSAGNGITGGIFFCRCFFQPRVQIFL